MGENPSYGTKGDHTVTLIINGQSIQMQPDHPVEYISWDDLQRFIQKLNESDPIYHYRLPTEAEWEYAARAGTSTVYSFGNDLKELPSYGWFVENSNRQTQPVKELKPNGFGLYDMHGNVYEWVSDWHADAPDQKSFSRRSFLQFWKKRTFSAIVDPMGPARGARRVIRGGSCNGGVQDLRSGYRANGCDPVSYGRDVGARLVRTPK